VNRLEFIALVSNAPGYPGLETLSVLTFGLRLEVVGAAVLAASRTPLEETTSGEFVTGRNHLSSSDWVCVNTISLGLFKKCGSWHEPPLELRPVTGL